MRRLSAALLVLALSASARADVPPLSPEETQAVNQLIAAYIHDHPKEVMSALEEAERQEKQASRQAQHDVLAQHSAEYLQDAAAPILGSPNGDVTVVEFFDYRCPYCKIEAASIERLAKEDPKVRIVLEDFPILGPDSVTASKVALVAQKHGKYTEFHEGAFAQAQKVTGDSAMALAESLGISAADLHREIASPEIAARLDRNVELGRTLQLEGTPTLIINGEAYASALDYADLKKLVDGARTKKS